MNLKQTVYSARILYYPSPPMYFRFFQTFTSTLADYFQAEGETFANFTTK